MFSLMREIQFRAKPCYDDGKQNAWVYGTFQYIAQRRFNPGESDNGTLEPRQDKGRIIDLYGTETEVMCYTLGQFTGCLDKNKNRIYEGDIVECVSWNEYFSNPKTGEVMQPFRRKMYVAFCNGGFKMIEPMPEPMKDNVWDIIYNGDIMIIGNLVDNPELIKKEE